MSGFTSGVGGEPTKIGAGELVSSNNIIFTYSDYEDGLRIGRFAKYTSGGIENIDGEADPIVAGVVKRDIANTIENGATYSANTVINVSAIESGLATVEVVAGLTINKFDKLYAYNGATTDDLGKATNDSADAVLVNGEFYSEISPTVWTVKLR